MLLCRVLLLTIHTTGMFQRLESMKKYAFGLMYIFGGEGDQRLAGIWLGRGGNNFSMLVDRIF